ncbi:MAG: HU family DNA-binding protein [Proteobacteria bacterium]|nr:HU family DNA-binding protein [Pseudomonadota bacterium]
MTKQELIDLVYKKRGLPAGVTKKAVGAIIDGVFAELGDYFIKSKITKASTPRFTYPGFGTFAKKKRGPRTGRHPRTGEPIDIPETNTVSFVVGSELKSLLNGDNK